MRFPNPTRPLTVPYHITSLSLPSVPFFTFPSSCLASDVSPGALLILGGPPTSSGAHHACIISPEGDYLLEHVTTSVCHTQFPVASLTPAALDTLLHLLETPPYCCSKKRLHSAYRGLDPSPRPTPVITSPAVFIRGTTSFPSFPVSLPPDVYRAPPLSSVLEATPASEKTLFLQPDAKPLVRCPSPRTVILLFHPGLPIPISETLLPILIEKAAFLGSRYLRLQPAVPLRLPRVRHSGPHCSSWGKPSLRCHPEAPRISS